MGMNWVVNVLIRNWEILKRINFNILSRLNFNMYSCIKTWSRHCKIRDDYSPDEKFWAALKMCKCTLTPQEPGHKSGSHDNIISVIEGKMRAVKALERVCVFLVNMDRRLLQSNKTGLSDLYCKFAGAILQICH